VCTAGTFALSGGVISGNTAYAGGGVWNGGIFVMSGGKISGNTANSKGTGGGVYNHGFNNVGGVSVTFTMSGGEITGNNAHNGGGLAYQEGSFKWLGGVISGNSAYLADADIHIWEIVPDGRPPNGNNDVSDENNGASDENNESNSGDDFGVGSDGGGEGEVGSAGKLVDDLFLSVVVIVGVVAIGFVIAILLFYRSKKQNQSATKSIVDSATV
jgi:hypothetical protein